MGTGYKRWLVLGLAGLAAALIALLVSRAFTPGRLGPAIVDREVDSALEQRARGVHPEDAPSRSKIRFTLPATSLFETRRDGVPSLARFESESRAAQWATEMESTIRGMVGPAIASLPGTTLSEVHCRSTACRIAVDLTPEFKEKIGSQDPGGVAFATDKILERTGPLARVLDALWDDHQVPPVTRLVRGIGLGGVSDWLESRRYARLLREESILMFDQQTYDPAAYAAWVSKQRSRMQAAKR